MNKQLPKIKNVSRVAKSRLFCVEAVDLEFSNGNTRTFERLTPNNRGAVMVAALNDNNEVLLVKEYAVGIEDYALGLVKGVIDAGEEPLDAANRELMEETGFGANNLEFVKTFGLAPAYMNHKMHFIIARNLFAKKLTGDEPEEIEVIPWPISKIDDLILREDFTEARSIAALLLLKQYLSNISETNASNFT